MPKTLDFGIVDVFAGHPLSGNPLAVVEGADQLDDATLKAIAREFNQSETTFVSPAKQEGIDWELRSFTAAGSEVFGAGHNALGAWLWLAESGNVGEIAGRCTFKQKIGSDILPVHVERRDGRIVVTMEHAPAQYGGALEDTAALARALGLDATDIMPEPAPRVVATGAAHFMVRLRDEAAVDRANPNGVALLAALGHAHDQGCYIYALRSGEGVSAYARFFNPSVGLVEDPATGSAAGPLAAYLGHEGYLEREAEFVVEQGTAIGRQSIMSLRIREVVELSGSGAIVMRGQLYL